MVMIAARADFIAAEPPPRRPVGRPQGRDGLLMYRQFGDQLAEEGTDDVPDERQGYWVRRL